MDPLLEDEMRKIIGAFFIGIDRNTFDGLLRDTMKAMKDEAITTIVMFNTLAAEETDLLIDIMPTKTMKRALQKHFNTITRSAPPASIYVTPSKSDAIASECSRIDSLLGLLKESQISVSIADGDRGIGLAGRYFSQLAQQVEVCDEQFAGFVNQHVSVKDREKLGEINMAELLSADSEKKCQEALGTFLSDLLARDTSMKSDHSFLLPRTVITPAGALTNVYPVSGKPDLVSILRRMLMDIKATKKLSARSTSLVANCILVLAQALERIISAVWTDAVLSTCIAFAVTGRSAFVVKYHRAPNSEGQEQGVVKITRISHGLVLPLWLAFSREAVQNPHVDRLPDSSILHGAIRQLGIEPSLCVTQLAGSSGSRVYNVSLLRRFKTLAASGVARTQYGCRAIQPDFTVKVVNSREHFLRERAALRKTAPFYEQAVQAHAAAGALQTRSARFYAITTLIVNGGDATDGEEYDDLLSLASVGGALADLTPEDALSVTEPLVELFEVPLSAGIESVPGLGADEVLVVHDVTLAGQAEAAARVRASLAESTGFETVRGLGPEGDEFCVDDVDAESTALSSDGTPAPSDAPTRWRGGAIIMRVGIPVEKWKDRAGITEKELAAQLFKAGSETLSAAHAGGIVHGDIRLSNFVLFADGVQLIDFDHACSIGTEVELSPGAIYQNKPMCMASLRVGDTVRWTERHDMQMLAQLCIKTRG